MSYIQIGSMIIRTEWILLAVTIIVGFVVAKIQLHNHAERKKYVDTIFNAVLIGLLVWKGSIILFQPFMVIDHPMSLLYFTGGVKGVWLGLISGAAYLIYKMKKDQMDHSLMVGIVLKSWTTGILILIILQSILGFKVSILVFVLLALGIVGLLIDIFLKKGAAIMGRLLLLFIVMGLVGWSIYDHLLLTESDSNASDMSRNEKAEVGIAIGDRAPEFELATLDGQQVRLSDYRGKRVVVNVWATWCPPCQAEIPEMVKFYEEYSNQDIEILAVNMTNSEKKVEDVKQFADEYGINFPILMDQEAEVASTYQAFTIPTTFIIDNAGIIVEKIAGPMSYEWMEKNIVTK
ncbi:peroxiredoxin family protein [Pseudalkalibacillus sp. Hm43]|uniref:peroxiredoxin family protein n=1 Tax=Pseudalkalibacillus sp. Hm43 TaxID=3450742 RepID=UPI003F43FEF1